MRENMGCSAEISLELPVDLGKYLNDSGDPSLEQGTIVDGKFELQRPLNRRGFGNVWKARLVGNKVYETALTFIPIAPDAWDFFRDSKRIRGIFRSVRALKHRNIQSVYCLRHSETFGPYLVSQWIEGVPLDEFADDPDNWICRDRLIPRRIAFQILASVAEALDYAHEQGVVHCGVNPQNIVVRRTMDGYEAVLSGFGVAEIEAEMRSKGLAAAADRPFQTPPEYMSPEQWKGKRRSLDGKTDQYSLGVVAYELFSGDPPFVLPAFLERNTENYLKYLRHDVLFREPEAGSSPDSLNFTLECALSKKKEERFSCCREFVRKLEFHCRD